MKRLILAAVLLGLWPSLASPSDPECGSWPTNMAFVHLKNAGLTDNEKVDFTRTRTRRVASEKIGKNLYRQVHFVSFVEKSGGTIEVITVNDASHEECSMSGVEVFVVAKRLGGG